MSPRPIKCAVAHSACVIEGDVVVGRAQANAVLSSGLLAQLTTHRGRFNPVSPRELSIIINYNDYYWPDGVVPYTFDSSLSSNSLVKSIMNEGILQYHALTNLRWVPWTNQSDYVIFQSSPGLCASSIGRIGGPQIVHLDGSGLCPPGSTVHEMAHVFGLFHTQARTDRDQYINVHWPNIQPNASDNYLQYNQLPNCDHCGQDALAYDYGSVMHYWNTEFLASNASGLTTFDPIPGPFNAFQAKYGNVTIGQRVGLSPIDLALLNLMYSSCLDNPPASCGTIIISSWVSAANGQYMSQGHLSNRTYWWSASTGLYVYYSSAYTAWILDTDILVSNGVADYIMSSAYFPPSSAYWTYLTASNPVITCGDTGTLAWQTNPWGACLMSYAWLGPIQNRTVWCRNSGTGQCVSAANLGTCGPAPPSTSYCSVSVTGCTFDSGTFCGANNPQDSSISEDTENWMLQMGASAYAVNGNNIGPATDYSGSGYYAKIGDFGYLDTGSAVLDWPPVDASNGSCRISFYTHTFAADATGPLGVALNLELRTFSDPAKAPMLGTLWTSGFQNVNRWVYQSVTLPNVTGDVFVRMVGYKPNVSPAILGVDNVVFTGCGTAWVIAHPGVPYPSPSPTTSVTPSLSPSGTLSVSLSSSVGSSLSVTVTGTNTGTATRTDSTSSTSTFTTTVTSSLSKTLTMTATVTPSAVASVSVTRSCTASVSATVSESVTESSSDTPSTFSISPAPSPIVLTNNSMSLILQHVLLTGIESTVTMSTSTANSNCTILDVYSSGSVCPAVTSDCFGIRLLAWTLCPGNRSTSLRQLSSVDTTPSAFNVSVLVSNNASRGPISIALVAINATRSGSSCGVATSIFNSSVAQLQASLCLGVMYAITAQDVSNVAPSNRVWIPVVIGVSVTLCACACISFYWWKFVRPGDGGRPRPSVTDVSLSAAVAPDRIGLQVVELRSDKIAEREARKQRRREARMMSPSVHATKPSSQATRRRYYEGMNAV